MNQVHVLDGRVAELVNALHPNNERTYLLREIHKLDTQRQVLGQAQVQETELFVQEVEVAVEAFDRLQPQHQFLLRPVLAYKVSQPGFDNIPDADQSSGQTVTTGLVTGRCCWAASWWAAVRTRWSSRWQRRRSP